MEDPELKPKDNGSVVPVSQTSETEVVKEKKPKEKKKKREKSVNREKERSAPKEAAAAPPESAARDGEMAVDSDYMHVTIGGQKIKIKTSPSYVGTVAAEPPKEQLTVEAKATGKEKRSRSKSPVAVKKEKSATPRDGSPAKPESSVESTPSGQVTSSERPPVPTVSADVIDLLGDSVMDMQQNQQQSQASAQEAEPSEEEAESSEEEQAAIDLLAELDDAPRSAVSAAPVAPAQQHSDILDLFGGGTGAVSTPGPVQTLEPSPGNPLDHWCCLLVVARTVVCLCCDSFTFYTQYHFGGRHGYNDRKIIKSKNFCGELQAQFDVMKGQDHFHRISISHLSTVVFVLSFTWIYELAL